jgi:hypothetical protein
MRTVIIYLLVIIGVIFTAIGGYLDYINTPRWGFSKEHYWNVGLICILLANFFTNNKSN